MSIFEPTLQLRVYYLFSLHTFTLDAPTEGPGRMPPRAPLDAEGGGSNMLPLEGGGRRGPPTLKKKYPVNKSILYQIKVTECLSVFLYVR